MLSASDAARAAVTAIETTGLLLLQDPALPSLARIVAGEVVRGSWWGHPAGGAIFTIAGELDDHPDIATMKLVAGKVTFVHRRLWPAVIAIGRARETWQTDALGSAKALLDRVEAAGELEVSGDDAKLLVARLLVHGTQHHTSAGHHVQVLHSWSRFATTRSVRDAPDVTAARTTIEHAVAAWAGTETKRATLPWQSRRKSK